MELPEVASPVSGNVSGGQRTAVHQLWHPSPHAVQRFLDGWRWFDSDQPPFVQRDTPVIYDTETGKMHAMWKALFVDHYGQVDGGDPPTVTDPFAN